MDPGIDLWYDFLIIKNGESSWQNGIIELNQTRESKDTTTKMENMTT